MWRSRGRRGAHVVAISIVAVTVLSCVFWEQAVIHITMQSSKPPSPPGAANQKETQLECVDVPNFNQTCVFQRVYLSPEGKLHIVVIGEESVIPEVGLFLWGGPSHKTEDVRVSHFRNNSEFETFLNSTKLERKRGLTLFFAEMYHNNWAHGIWDALYPAFVALAKFGRHGEGFRPLLAIKDRNWAFNCSSVSLETAPTSCAIEEVYRLFGSSERKQGSKNNVSMMFLHDIVRSRSQTWYVFDELVAGSGHMGQYGSVLSLPGGMGLRRTGVHGPLLRLFVDRLYLAHGLKPPARRQSSMDRRSWGRSVAPLVVAISTNKRYSSEFATALEMAAAKCNSAIPGVIAKVVDWGAIRPFSRQLEEIRSVDVHVSSIGTGLFYSLLLADGAVSVNLGHAHQREGSTVAAAVDYGEEFIGGASNRALRSIFAPIGDVRRGLSEPDVVNLVWKAVTMIRGGFSSKSWNLDDNLSDIGRIVYRLLQLSELSKKGLNGVTNGTYDFFADLYCPHRFPSAIVFETDPENLKMCSLDLPLLRKLKRDANLDKIFGYTPECGCVACLACQPGQT